MGDRKFGIFHRVVTVCSGIHELFHLVREDLALNVFSSSSSRKATIVWMLKTTSVRDGSPVLINVSKPVANFPLLPTNWVGQLVSYSSGVRLLLAIKANLGEERGGGGGPLSCRTVLNHGSGLQGEYKKLSLVEVNQAIKA